MKQSTAWSPVCGDQMSLYNEIREEFARFGAQLAAWDLETLLEALQVAGERAVPPASRDRRR